MILASSDPEQEQVKQRDQSLRKQEQEMDSLSFRNQQLAKRVELLQEELAVCDAKGRKGKVIQGRAIWACMEPPRVTLGLTLVVCGPAEQGRLALTTRAGDQERL